MLFNSKKIISKYDICWLCPWCGINNHISYIKLEKYLKDDQNERAIKIKEDENFICVKLTPYCFCCKFSRTFDCTIEKHWLPNNNQESEYQEPKQQIKETCKDCNGTKKYVGLFSVEPCKSCC